MTIQEYALYLGFSAAIIMDTKNLTIVPEYRKYCEENLCGCYNRIPVCPPECGSVEEMAARILSYEKVLVLQTILSSEEEKQLGESKKIKAIPNRMAEKLVKKLEENGIRDYLVMSAGPWKNYSCLSAYCIDAQKMAEYAGLDCWKNDGFHRYFTLILAHDFV